MRKCDKVEWGKKYHYASDILTDLMFNLLFYIEKKSKLHGKFQRVNAVDESIKMLKNG